MADGEKTGLKQIIEEYCKLLADGLPTIGKHINLENYHNKLSIKKEFDDLKSKDKTVKLQAIYRIWFFGQGGGETELLGEKIGLKNSDLKQQIYAISSQSTSFTQLLGLKGLGKEKQDEVEKRILEFADIVHDVITKAQDELNAERDPFKFINEFNYQTVKRPMAAIRELFFYLNMDKVPLLNGAADNACKYINEIFTINKEKPKGGTLDTINYIKGLIEKHSIEVKLKDKYEKIPLYYLVDQFLNLLDKIIENDKFDPYTDDELKNQSKIKGTKEFYENVWEYLKDSESKQKSLKMKEKISELESSLTDDKQKNLIVYGAPGTGKTFNVLQLIKEQLRKSKKEENENEMDKKIKDNYKIIQFHPSYDYEDFIEGIKPTGIDKNGNMKFELVNGVFKEFCKNAYEKQNEKFYFIIDEINRAELSRVMGELMFCLEYRIEDANGSTENLLETKYTNYIKSLDIEEHIKNYSVICKDGCYGQFGIPENVFIIGTMNSTDRSIDSFDLALRRRFKWIKLSFNKDVLSEVLNYANILNYIEFAVEVNKQINDKNGLNLPTDFEIGHSYFLNIKEFAKNNSEIKEINIKKLIDYYLKPLLTEYARSFVSEEELDKKVKEVFTNALGKFNEKPNDKQSGNTN